MIKNPSKLTLSQYDQIIEENDPEFDHVTPVVQEMQLKGYEEYR